MAIYTHSRQRNIDPYVCVATYSHANIEICVYFILQLVGYSITPINQESCVLCTIHHKQSFLDICLNKLSRVKASGFSKDRYHH